MPKPGPAKEESRKLPDRRPQRDALPVTPRCEPGWDLREVDDAYLVAELIRRGYGVQPNRKR